MKSVENSKGTVRFSFKDTIKKLKENSKLESLIFLHFSFGGDRLKYSTGYKSCYQDWDFQKQRIKEGKAGILNSGEVNEHLSKLEIHIKKEYSRLVAEQIPVTKINIKTFLDNFTNKNFEIKKNVVKTFFEYVEEYIELRAAEISEVTIRSYKQTVLKLKEYEIESKEKLDFNSFDKVFHSKFIKFLNKRDYSLNTIGKHIKNLKVMLNNALADDLTDNLKFKNRDFKSYSEETTAIYLNDEELTKMLALDLSKFKNLELARDIFLIGCYTGQRVSDYNGLKSDSIVEIDGNKFFNIRQQKTKNIVSCPITSEIREIMEKRHKGLPPKKMTEQYINNYIKKVGEMLELDELITCSSTRGGVAYVEQVPKYSLIHTHTARRSFCTNMYKKKLPVIDIMLFSGHKTEKEFNKYIRIKDQERASHIVTLGYFNM